MTDEERHLRRKLNDEIALAIAMMAVYTFDLSAGTITSHAWAIGIHGILANQHAAAVAIGRHAANPDSPVSTTETDKIVGQMIADNETLWLSGFRDAVAEGAYTEADSQALKADAIAKRLRMYALKIEASANEAFVEASPAGSTFRWNLDDDTDHCQGNHLMNCPAIAKKGPYTRYTIPTYPRAGATPCLTHCKCWLTRLEDGAQPFEPAAEEN